AIVNCKIPVPRPSCPRCEKKMKRKRAWSVSVIDGFFTLRERRRMMERKLGFFTPEGSFRRVGLLVLALLIVFSGQPVLAAPADAEPAGTAQADAAQGDAGPAEAEGAGGEAGAVSADQSSVEKPALDAEQAKAF